MPNVDFTLEDVAKLIEKSAEDVKSSIAIEFVSFWEHNLSPAFEELHQEFGIVKDRLERVESRVTIVESHVRELKRSARA